MCKFKKIEISKLFIEEQFYREEVGHIEIRFMILLFVYKVK